jgi:hypothetical protein
MSIDRRAVLPLKVFLLGLFAILVVFQTLSMPGKFAYLAQVSPQDAHLRWPLTALAAFWILCAEIVVVSTWRLLTLIERDRIFSTAAFLWVDAIVWSIGAAWAVLVGVLAYFFAVVYEWDDPGLPMVLLLLTAGVTAVALLMVVMRALLRQATALRTEMEAVI